MEGVGRYINSLKDAKAKIVGKVADPGGSALEVLSLSSRWGEQVAVKVSNLDSPYLRRCALSRLVERTEKTIRELLAIHLETLMGNRDT